MPTPSYKQIKRELAQARRMLTKLSEDPHYGIYTRAALEFELPRVKSEARYLVFLDIDDCHGLNEKFGYEGVNKKVKRCLRIRHADVLLRARWFSGDEIVVILRGDPEGFIERLRTCMKNEEISATFAYVPFTGLLEDDVRMASAIVQARKCGYALA